MNETVYLFALSSPELLQQILALAEAPLLLPARLVPLAPPPQPTAAR